MVEKDAAATVPLVVVRATKGKAKAVREKARVSPVRATRGKVKAVKQKARVAPASQDLLQ
jgi:hypothetical protein